MRKIYTALSVLLFLAPACALASQVFVTGSSLYMNTAAAAFWPFGMYTSTAGQAATSNNNPPISIAGTMSALYVNVPIAPAGSGQYVFAFTVNGIASVLTCTIAGAATSCSDTTHSTTTSAGDRVEIKVTPSNTPAGTPFNASALFVPTTPTDTAVLWNINASVVATNAYAALSSRPGILAAESTTTQTLFLGGGVLDQLRFNNITAPGVGTSFSFFLRNKMSTSTVTCTVADASAGQNTCTDVTHTLSVNDGDLVNLVSAPVGTPATSAYGAGARFTPTTAGKFLFLASTPATADAGAGPFYFSLQHGASVGTTTEASVQTPIASTTTFTKIGVSVVTTPTSGTVTYALRVNGVTSSLSCTVANPNLTCTGNDVIVVNTGDLVDTVVIKSSSTNATVPRITYVATNAPVPVLDRGWFKGAFIRLYEMYTGLRYLPL